MQRTKVLSFKVIVLLFITCLVVPLIKEVTVHATS